MQHGAGSSSGGLPVHENSPGITGIARLIRENRFTGKELASTLGITTEQLENRLALMERQGYLIMERPCAVQTGGGGACAGCRSCGKRTSVITGYALTEKGCRLAAAGIHPPGSGIKKTERL